MPARQSRRPTVRTDPATENRKRGLEVIRRHPLFAPLASGARWHFERDDDWCPPDGWAVVTCTGQVYLNPRRRGEPDEWSWVAAHCLLHLGFGHLARHHLAGWREATGLPAGGRAGGKAGARFDEAWNFAACVAVNRFLAHLKVGRPPEGLGGPTSHDHLAGAVVDETAFARRLRSDGIMPALGQAGTAGQAGDLRWEETPVVRWSRKPVTWPDLLAAGLETAVGMAVDVAGGVTETMTGEGGRKTRWRQALGWFVSSYPLLGALAAGFKLVEDAEVCRLHGIKIAAISPAAAELYVNPQCGLTDGEYRFVIAHELLHAGLRHDTRGAGRDPWLWNVACDFVINGWLAEMEVGDLPDSALYDRSLRGKSAEEVYDQVAQWRRRAWRLATMRGQGVCDILPQRLPGRDDPAWGVDLDEFYRRCLADGIDYHRRQERGLLPAGLVEEIRALTEPPVPWDVELARWFDDHFVPLERRRSYARASRRQSATPDIPRPGWHVPEELMRSRTFGVVLDTSGSMDRPLLGKALGAIASYAVTRDVSAVRVVFCDAQAHDNGWMHPFDIAGRVRVRGRGGTVLQPGIDLLQDAADFPRDGPILVITDALIDRVRIKREHAFLIPAGAVLPFPAGGPVFRFS
jgi:predicted metal-dependent peptidase